MPNNATSGDRRLTDAELAWFNATFADNDTALKALRKVFLYQLDDDDTPIGLARDMWTTLDLKNLSHEDKLILVEARQMMINHLEGALRVIKMIAGTKKESPEQIVARLQKDSAK